LSHLCFKGSAIVTAGRFEISLGKHKIEFDQTGGIDISVPIYRGPKGVRAFSIPEPLFTPVVTESFLGDVSKGGACNCVSVTINPHGHCTHTECIGHLTAEPNYISELRPPVFSIVNLISVEPELLDNGDRVISAEGISAALKGASSHLPAQAVIIRTSFKPAALTLFSGSNPPYFTVEAIHTILEQGISHLLTDLPSLDCEEDGGKLLAHRAFWEYPESPKYDRFITEMVQVPETLKDGEYLLNLHLALQEADAVPSRPILFPLNMDNIQ